MRRRYKLTFPSEVSRQPIVYRLVKDYDLIPNILRSEIQMGTEGRMLLEVTGTKKNLDAAEEWLGEQQLEIIPAATQIEHDESLCVDCGLCTAVCRNGALMLDELGALVIERDKCVMCELCVTTCPRRAIRLVF